MAEKANLGPLDPAERKEAERLDLEMRARLEAGLIDSFSTSSQINATQPPPAGEHQESKRASFWRKIKRLFK